MLRTDKSALEITVPVQLLSLGDDFPWRTVDMRSEGSGLAETLTEVTQSLIATAHHFSFLPIFTELAPILLVEEGEDPICTNSDGLIGKASILRGLLLSLIF